MKDVTQDFWKNSNKTLVSVPSLKTQGIKPSLSAAMMTYGVICIWVILIPTVLTPIAINSREY